MSKPILRVGRFKATSKKNGKRYEYFRLFVTDEKGDHWVSDYIFPNWLPADSEDNPINMRPFFAELEGFDDHEDLNNTSPDPVVL